MSKAVCSKSDAETMALRSPCEQGGDGSQEAGACSKRSDCRQGMLCRAMHRYYNRGPRRSYPPERERIPTRQLFDHAEIDGGKR